MATHTTSTETQPCPVLHPLDKMARSSCEEWARATNKVAEQHSHASWGLVDWEGRATFARTFRPRCPCR